MNDEKGRQILVSCIVVNEEKEILLLHKIKHDHYETPGGKLESGDLLYGEGVDETAFKRGALRELHEEVGEDIIVEDINLFKSIVFTKPRGKKAVVHKFLMRFKEGNPVVMEKAFDEVRWIPINELEHYKISPDLVLLLEEMKERLA